MEVVKYLVEHEADIHAEEDEPIIVAARGGHLAIVEYFVSKGANIHAKQETALCSACYNGKIDVVKYIVEQHYPDIHASPRIGYEYTSPIRSAIEYGSLELVEYLLSKGADPNTRDNVNFDPQFRGCFDYDFCLCLAIELNHVDIVECLLQNGANLHIFHTDDEYVLCKAVKLGYIGMVKCLLRWGADVKVRTTNDDNLLCYAVDDGQFEIVQALLSHGASVYVNIENGLPLRTACRKEYFDIAKLLIDRGAHPINLTDDYKRYINFLNRGAIRKIINWWIPICYDTKRACGQRMMEKNYQNYIALCNY